MTDIKKTRKGGRLAALSRNRRALYPFVIALTVIQMLYAVLFFSMATDWYVTEQTVSAHYDYELEYRAMTQRQYVTLYDACGESPVDPGSAPYVFVRYTENADGSYNACIKLQGRSPADSAALFQKLYGLDDMSFACTPLYDYKAEYLPDIVSFIVLSTLFVFALSVFLLMQLFRTKLDRDTFEYGIYTAFGATMRRLYGRSVGELLLISSLVCLPSLTAGCGVAALLYRSRGVALHLSLGALVLTLVFSIATVLTAVYLPMKRLSKQAPVELLRARDNSHHVTSPRRSHRIFGVTFPRDLELLTLWRYRRYIAIFLLSAVLLPALFIGMLSFADIYEDRAQVSAPDFTVTFTPSVVNAESLGECTAEVAKSLGAVEGVLMCLPEAITYPAIGRTHHMLLSDSNLASTDSVTVLYRGDPAVEGGNPYDRATNRYDYTALDEAAIEALERQYTNIEGDLYSVLEDDHTIVISESLQNTAMFDFSVGDTILLSVSAVDATAVELIDPNRILIEQLERGTFLYEEFTVGAVIHDVAPGDRLTVGVNFAAYTLLAGERPIRYSADVYLSDGLDFGDWKRISNAVYSEAYGYYNCSVTNHDLFFDRYLSSLSNVEGRLRVLAWSVLAVTPLICFCAQRVFYRKREGEWNMLRALGATQKQIFKTALLSGVVTAGITLVLSFLLSLISTRLLFSLFNRYLPAGGFIESVVLTYRIPWGAMALLPLLAVLCGLIPPLMAGLSYQKRGKNRTVSLMAGR
jgi:hypothetical protein